VAAGGLTSHGVVVDHDHPGGFWGRVREGLLDLPEIALIDVPNNAKIAEAACQGAARDAVRGVAPRYHHPRLAGDLKRRVELRGDVPGVLGVLELVGGLPPDVQIAGDGADPAHVVVTGDDDDGGSLADLVEIGASLDELGGRAALREVARDGHRVRRELHDAAFQRIELLLDRRTAEM
jgi:hypothetical protein